MNVLHYMRKEDSGLARSTLEIVKYEEKLGHGVSIRQPGEDTPLYGTMEPEAADVVSIHSQLPTARYFDGKPKIMWMHGEPLSSVGNGVSMKAIVDLAPKCDAFICMRKRELNIWNSIRRTYLVDKGIDLEYFTPADGPIEKLEGEPAILYCENWRGQRNPLYLCVAMQKVLERLPKARLHLWNCGDKKMADTFQALVKHCKWWSFVRNLKGQHKDINELYQQADIVVSCLFPLYARSLECFGAGKPLVCPGYDEHDYPYQCTLDPDSIAAAIIKAWEERGTMDFRKWAEEHHDAKKSAQQALDVYRRYL